MYHQAMSRKVHTDSRSFAAVDLFRGVSERGLHKIAELARVRQLRRRASVFSQDCAEVRAHAVLEGAVNIVQSASDGSQVAMRIVGPGQTFGTVSLFTNGRYPADAVTMSETLEASWSETDFLSLVDSHPPIAVNLIRIIGTRLREMQDRVRELSTVNAERRIAHTVLRLAGQNGRKTSAGIALDVPLRRKDIAELAGTTLHTASRLLSGWEKAGTITNRKRILTIARPAELRAIAGI